jgi:acyl transferase domain-containing protein/phosphopantetheinyl transferase (holo-ACP synthase)
MTTGTTGARGGVAIVGMACLFPGAPDVDAYWANILGKVDAVTDPPPEAWDPDVYYDPDFSDVDRTYCRRGGYLGSLATFDPLRHGIPPVAVGGEPDQWLALAVAHAALADAGGLDLSDEIRMRTAIILGKGTYLNGGNAIAVQRGLVVGQTIDLIRQLHPEYAEDELDGLRAALQDALPPLTPDTVPGLIPNIIVGRIANRLDLMGPAYTVDAACASSLVAVGHAVRDLLSGDCDLALAGGSQVWMPVATLNLFCRLGALSRSEQLRAFDQDADGTLLGEGIGMVVLKRLPDALRDDDRVYAVIRGVGVSSDGRGLGVMAPRREGEELALRRAYEAAGVDPRSVGLIEAHGTGTPVGDVTEVRSLTAIFGEREGELPRCALGSVKSMISHTIPAAGVAGLIKTALALHHRVLPPTLHCEAPNPDLELDRTPFYINTETRPWIHGSAAPRRAGVNAFGFGGINAHAVLEAFDDEGRRDHSAPWDSEVCVLEAKSALELADRAAGLAAALAEDEDRFALVDLAHTLARDVGSDGGGRRLAIVATSVTDLRAKLGQAVDKLRAPDCRRIRTRSGIYYEAEPLGPGAKCALVFPGEGSQYPNMLSDLCRQFPEARGVFDRIDRLYIDHPRGHVLSDWVFPRPAFSEAERARTEARLMDLDIAVESVLTANAAVHAVVRRLVRRIDALVGHSTGEHSAAMAAGALDLDSDDRLAAFCLGLHDAYADAAERHRVPAAILLALGTDARGARRIAATAGPGLFLAMDNCPHQVVLVGDVAAAGRARELAAADGIVCEQLPYDRAVHTPLFAPYAEDLRAVFSQLPVRSPHGALWSCTTAAPCPEDPGEIRELLVEHWTSPVRFRETVEALHDDGVRIFIETGPRGNLTAFVGDILRDRQFCAVAADTLRRPGIAQLNHLAAMLAAHDVDLDLPYLSAGRGAREVDWQTPAADGPRSGTALPLSTSWPMLRLDDEVLDHWRPMAPEPLPAPAPALLGPEPGALPPELVPQPEIALAVNGAAMSTPAAPAALLEEDAGSVIDAHLETMERFLSVSADVMTTYLGAPGTHQPPLVGEIVALRPGEELVARREVDRRQDLYLRDHSFAWMVSRSDPSLAALTVMPLAMTIEILAEAAAALMPGLVVTGMRALRGHRWLEVGDEPLLVELHATRLSDDGPAACVRVELFDVPAGAEAIPVAEAVVRLEQGFAPAPPPAVAPPADGRPSRRHPDDLYGEVMFHGPMWQGVQAIDLVAGGGVAGRLRVLPRDGLLRDTPAPNFVLDPVVLDAAGQLIGFWAAETQERAKIVFPFRLEALDVYGPLLAEGTVVSCLAAVERRGDRLVSSDIEITDGSGRCWMCLRGWQDRRFDVPAALRPLTAAAQLTPLSRPWPGPASPAGAPSVQLRRLDVTAADDAAFWLRVWASRVLARSEHARFDALTMPVERRLEWLAARTAAKEAVAELIGARCGVTLLPAEIEVVPAEAGQPVIVTPYADALDVVPLVSLAHTGGRAVAAAALVPAGAAAGVGVDIELLRPLPAGFADTAAPPAERRLLEAVPGDEWLLRAWCAKEAAGKAVGRGMGAGAGAPAIAGVSPADGVMQVEVAGRPVRVQTWRDGDLVAAVATYQEGDSQHA